MRGFLRPTAKDGSIFRHPVDFGQARNALLDLDQGGSTQVAYSRGFRRRSNFHHIAALEDDPGDRLVDRHYLIDARTPLVALVAHRAADAVEELQAIEILR